MPTYEYKCPCGERFDRFLPLSEYQTIQECKCGQVAAKQLSAPSVFVPQDICYSSPIDGRPITSMKDRIEDLKRSDCVPWEPGIKEDGLRNDRMAEEASDKLIEDTVRSEIASMTPSKRTQLASELASGADTSFTRA